MKEQHYLVGIVSWGGLICGSPDSPSVFARVTYQLDWIKERIEGDECPISNAATMFSMFSHLTMIFIYVFHKALCYN